MALDISDRTRLEASVRDREERYRLMARATNDVIWDWGFETGEVVWNDAVHEVFPLCARRGRRARRVVVRPDPSRRSRACPCQPACTLLRIIQRALGGDAVVKADKGRDALVLLERDQAFDVILCDLMMGDMTGMDLHAEVERRWPQLAQRFVFMTGGAFIEAASKFLKRIPNACVEKPFDLDTLRAAVATRR